MNSLRRSVGLCRSVLGRWAAPLRPVSGCHVCPPVLTLTTPSRWLSGSVSVSSSTPAGDPGAAAVYDDAVAAIDAARALEMSGDDGKAQADAWKTARRLLHMALDDGDARAATRLGRWYVFGVGGCAVDFKKAWDLCLRAHDAAEDPEAQYWLGRMCLQGAGEGIVEGGGCGGGGGGDGDASAGAGTGAGADTTATASFSETDPPAPRPSSVDEAQERYEQAAATWKEIKTMRKAAKAAKVARVLEQSASDASDERRAALRTLQSSPDTPAARFWLNEAAQRDHGPAQVMLGNLCMQQSPPEVSTARQWYTMAAHNPTQPQPDAYYNLGLLNYESTDSKEQAAALDCFQRAAALGDTAAVFWLGHTYRVGDAVVGVHPNPELAMEHLTQAADAGHGGALHYLSRAYYAGDDALGVSADRGKRWEYLLAAADADHPDALFDIGTCHLEGSEGVEVSPHMAAAYLTRAGEAGSAEALCSLGAMQYHGIGARENKQAAFNLYQRAGELGFMPAWERVAAMYMVGDGVQQCTRSAEQIMDVVKKHKGAAV